MNQNFWEIIVLKNEWENVCNMDAMQPIFDADTNCERIFEGKLLGTSISGSKQIIIFYH